jgi:3-oxoadipate enol-lactonase
MKARLADGAELFYTIDDFTSPWTQPETVVLHHGMAKNHKLWYAWVPILAQHYRVVRFDMRGMGQSSVPAPGYPWSLENLAFPVKTRNFVRWGHPRTLDEMSTLINLCF